MRRLLPLLAVVAACAPENGPASAPANRPAPPAGKKPDFSVPLRLVGRDPAWTGRVAPDGLRIGGRTPGAVFVPWFTPVVTGGVARWRTSTPEGSLDITLTPEACSDGTDQRYAFSAVVVLNGRTLRGCAAPETEFTWVE
jgi:uncharacterized membrane protein